MMSPPHSVLWCRRRRRRRRTSPPAPRPHPGGARRGGGARGAELRLDPKREPFSSSRSILDEFLRQEKPLVQRTKDQITGATTLLDQIASVYGPCFLCGYRLLTTIEGDECCSCWDAYFELNKLSLPKKRSPDARSLLTQAPLETLCLPVILGRALASNPINAPAVPRNRTPTCPAARKTLAVHRVRGGQIRPLHSTPARPALPLGFPFRQRTAMLGVNRGNSSSLDPDLRELARRLSFSDADSPSSGRGRSAMPRQAFFPRLQTIDENRDEPTAQAPAPLSPSTAPQPSPGAPAALYASPGRDDDGARLAVAVSVAGGGSGGRACNGEDVGAIASGEGVSAAAAPAGVGRGGGFLDKSRWSFLGPSFCCAAFKVICDNNHMMITWFLFDFRDKIREYRDDSKRLDQCNRLDGLSPFSFEFDARRITQLSAGAARHSLSSDAQTDFSQLLTMSPSFHCYSSSTRRPSSFVQHTVSRFEDNLGECCKWILELEQLVRMKDDKTFAETFGVSVKSYV
ncbi:hypothetical protein HU200_066507 [Digitaria exilis]|uniref:Uncharacterized protein n=1 Tax=Digitaria exilis TaxID=1010633 RepID=A0A835A6G6_9POAL|nr:hypothetical protein HU200_066507 [Digitaria exilis]